VDDNVTAERPEVTFGLLEDVPSYTCRESAPQEGTVSRYGFSYLGWVVVEWRGKRSSGQGDCDPEDHLSDPVTVD
jgi:hypothetical protein